MPRTGRKFAYDIETNGLYWEATVIHSLVLIDLDTEEVISCADQPGYVPIKDGLKLLMEAAVIIGHNTINFDNPTITKLCPWWKPKGLVLDTLIYSRVIFTDMREKDEPFRRVPPKLKGSHSLEAWGLRLRYWKGDYSKEMEAHGSDPWAAWNKEMQDYCVQDVQVTLFVWKRLQKEKLAPMAVWLEHMFAEIITHQHYFGFGFNEEGAVKLYGKLSKRRMEVARDMADSFPPKVVETVFIPKVNNKTRGYAKGVPFLKRKSVEFNPSSRQMIAERLIEKGWEPTEFTPSGQPKVDETILSGLPYREAEVLAEHFLIEKRIGMVAEGKQAWLKLVRKGRIHGSVNTNGAVTGRCTHSAPNVAQVPSVTAPYGAECRDLFGAFQPGWVQVGADASGLELRCLAHFMAKHDEGAYRDILLEGDIHWANVKALGLTTEERDDTDPLHKLYRDGAKTFIYGFLYGAGAQKIGEIIQEIVAKAKRDGLEYKHLQKTFFKGADNPTVEHLESAGKKLKKNFLNKTPALRKLRNNVKVVCQQRGHLRGLDGRKLVIRSAHSALNTLLQSAGSLIVKLATVLAFMELLNRKLKPGKDFGQMAHVHDEVQYSSKEKHAGMVGEVVLAAFKQAGERFSFKCPIDGEYKIGKTWKACH